jgi:hypothetical protein
VNRIYAAASIAEEFAARLAAATAALRIGYGLDPGVEYGLLINEAVRQRTHEHVADAIARGATVLAGGRVLDGVQYERGFYYLPMVLARVRSQMRVMREETFGPVAPVMAVANLDEALYHAAGATPDVIEDLLIVDALLVQKGAPALLDHKVLVGTLNIAEWTYIMCPSRLGCTREGDGGYRPT